MKTFLLDIIPRIQRFSQKIDDLTSFMNKHWVLMDDSLQSKVVYIFREKDNQLLISVDGEIEKGTWEYLGNNSLMIESNGRRRLFKHGFIDDSVLAIKVDGKDEYALFVNESRFENELNNLALVLSFLSDSYQSRKTNQTTQTTKAQAYTPPPSFEIQTDLEAQFEPEDHPSLLKDLDAIKSYCIINKEINSADIVIAYCRDHSLPAHFFVKHNGLAEKVANHELPISYIEYLFSSNSSNVQYIGDFEKYIKTQLAD